LDVALKVEESNFNSALKACFNPCSLGCCSERVLIGVTREIFTLVSILVLLDVALKGEIIDRKRVYEVVSILVLLDVALKAYNVVLFAIDLGLFQSLFSWMLL